ncbi:MAG: flagellar biosynthesis protein FlhF [Proteobacteria bacterium]|nr:flagellar biosynthesis protein FlhF [Pseudomonadota bacterium]
MYIKRYSASTVKDAMKSIKAELGTEALILNTKKISSNTGTVYEVVAAVERDPKGGPEAASAVEPVSGSNRRRPEELYANMASSTSVTSGGTAQSAPPVVSSSPVATVALSGAGAEADRGVNSRIEEELHEIKEFCAKVMAATKTPVSKVIGSIEAEMLRNGIDKRLVNNILIKSCSEIADEKMSDRLEIQTEMKHRVARALKVQDPLTDGSVMAFVGPTGVGKTTTIAKLAAIHALKKKKKVAMITFDNYRIAAVEQIKVYGKLIGAPVDLAKDPMELSRLIRSHADKDLILIDTAGRDSSNKAHIGELQMLAELEPRVKFNLVLSAQMRDTSLYDSVRNFSSVDIDSLTFTKLDESDVYGPIFNTMVLAGKSLAYLTNGQRVPEDIEVATKERLLDIFLPC